MGHFILKNSGGVDKAPTIFDLLPGEIAINTVTGAIYTRMIDNDGEDIIGTVPNSTILTQTFQPEFTIPESCLEGETVLVTLLNYDYRKYYKIYVSGGVIDSSTHPFLWTLPSVSETTSYSIRMSASELGSEESVLTETRWITVSNISEGIDGSIILNSTNINRLTVPYSDVDEGSGGVIEIKTSGDIVETALFQQELDDGDWKSYTVSVQVIHDNLVDYMSQEDSTNESLKFEQKIDVESGEAIYVEQNGELMRTEVGNIVEKNMLTNVKDCQFNGYSIYYLTEENSLITRGYYQTSLSNVKEFSVGHDHALAVKDDGSLWVMGGLYSLTRGVFGTGEFSKYISWTHLTEFTNVKYVSCGMHTSLVTLDTGDVYVCGRNDDYALGNGVQTDIYVWNKIYNNFKNIKSINSNYYNSTIFLSEEGALIGAGQNKYNELQEDDNLITTTKALAQTDIDKVAYGRRHYLLLKNDGTLWGSGNNSSGQLLDFDLESFEYLGIDNVIDISTSQNTSYILTSDKKIYGFGDGDNYLLGRSAINASKELILINTPSIPKKLCRNSGINTCMYIDMDGGVYALGKELLQEHNLSFTFRKTKFSSRTGWEFLNMIPPLRKTTGQDFGARTPMLPISCSHYTCSKIDSSGILWVRGKNLYNKFGADFVLDEVYDTWQMTNQTLVKQVVDNERYITILKEDGLLYVSGNNLYGVFGTGTSEDVNSEDWTVCPSISDVIYINSYSNRMFAIKRDGSVWCVGQAGYCLGLGNSSQQLDTWQKTFSSDNIIRISNYNDNTALLADNGKVYLSGSSNYIMRPYGARKTWVETALEVKEVFLAENTMYTISTDDKFYLTGATYYHERTSIYGNYNNIEFGKGNEYFCPVGSYRGLLIIRKDTNKIYVSGNDAYDMFPFRNEGTHYTNIYETPCDADYIDSRAGKLIIYYNDGSYKICGNNTDYSLTNTVTGNIGDPIFADANPDDDIYSYHIRESVPYMESSMMPTKIYKAHFKTSVIMKQKSADSVEYVKANLMEEPSYIGGGLEYKYSTVMARGRNVQVRMEGLIKSEYIIGIKIDLEKYK